MMVVSQLELNTSRREYSALLKVSQPSADVLERIGNLEQMFDLIDMGEIEIEEKSCSSQNFFKIVIIILVQKERKKWVK